MRGLMLLVAAIAACARGPIAPRPSPGTKNAKVTIGMQAYVGPDRWQRSGYYDPIADMTITYPVFLAVAGDGTACIVEGMTWGAWQRGDVVVCPGRWRFRRPV